VSGKLAKQWDRKSFTAKIIIDREKDHTFTGKSVQIGEKSEVNVEGRRRIVQESRGWENQVRVKVTGQ